MVRWARCKSMKIDEVLEVVLEVLNSPGCSSGGCAALRWTGLRCGAQMSPHFFKNVFQHLQVGPAEGCG